MARTINYVTRTVNSTTATVKVCNISNNTLEDIVVVVPNHLDKNDCTKWIKKNYELPASTVFVAVTDIEFSSKMYGMIDNEFVLLAHSIQNTNRRNLVTKNCITTYYKLTYVDSTNLANGVANTVERITGDYTDDELKKVVSKKYKDTNIVVINVEHHTTEENLMGMTYDEFIRYAVELDPETRKPL